jgi:hypothetical protein
MDTQRPAIQDYPNRAPARARRTPDACSGDRLQRQPEPEPAPDRQLTVLGLRVGYLLGCAVVIETIYALPGMGQLMINES